MKTIKGNYRKESTALAAAVKELKAYYSVRDFKRNKWRYNNAVEEAKKQLKEKGYVDIEGAQWGAKWGNYMRRVALNSEGRYEFVQGFNTSKKLGF